MSCFSNLVLPCGCSINGPCRVAALLYKRLEQKRRVVMSPFSDLTKKMPRKSKLYLHLEFQYDLISANKELNILSKAPSI